MSEATHRDLLRLAKDAADPLSTPPNRFNMHAVRAKFGPSTKGTQLDHMVEVLLGRGLIIKAYNQWYVA